MQVKMCFDAAEAAGFYLLVKGIGSQKAVL